MKGSYHRHLAAIGLCFAVGYSGAEPVLVRLGNLAWVTASEGLPRSIGGRMMVPPQAACDLLGLQCQIKAGSMDASGPLGKLSVQLHQGLTELRPLTLITGYTLGYDPRSGAALLSANKAGQAPWLDIQRSLPSKAQDLPLDVRLAAPSSGHPNRILTLDSPGNSLQGLHLTLYSKSGHSLTTIGSLAPTTPDNPGSPHNASGYVCPRATCTLSVPRNALWTLAYLGR